MKPCMQSIHCFATAKVLGLTWMVLNVRLISWEMAERTDICLATVVTVVTDDHKCKAHCCRQDARHP